MRSRFLALFCLLVSTLSSVAHAQPKADGLCLAKQCGTTLVSCGLDKDCRDWLQCVLQCGDDKIRCPSVCGFYYQSSFVNKTSQCIFDSQCVDVGFSTLPAYEHQERPILDLAGVEGTYWFAASASKTKIFDFDCQRFDFASDTQPTNAQQNGRVRVNFGVPLTLSGTARITAAHGAFTQLATGAIDVAYDNFAGYHENWFIVDKTPQTILAHVCIAAASICYDYGTILLSKVPLTQLDPSESQRLDKLLNALFSLELSTMHKPNITGCPNQTLPAAVSPN